jgi:hypothetical protein
MNHHTYNITVSRDLAGVPQFELHAWNPAVAIFYVIHYLVHWDLVSAWLRLTSGEKPTGVVLDRESAILA